MSVSYFSHSTVHTYLICISIQNHFDVLFDLFIDPFSQTL